MPIPGASAAPRFQSLMEAAADAIWALDADGRITYANAATAVLVGLAVDDLVGRSQRLFVDPSDHDRAELHQREVLRGSSQRAELVVRRVDGVRRSVSVVSAPIVEDGRATGILSVARDVTEERLRAAALERAEVRYTRLVESAEDAIVTLDDQGCLTSVNRAFERVTGRPRHVLLGSSFLEFADPSESGALRQMFAATLAGKRQRREVRFAYADGQAGISMILSTPIFERDRVTGVLAIARDVTEEHLLFEQVVRREKLAALGELVGGVAHEINTPLTGILAFAQLLLVQGGLNAEGRQAAETIANETKRAARIVGKLLTFARQTPPERLPTDLNQVLHDSLELRRYPLRSQRITLETDLEAKLPVTWADPSQLQQVFLNLLSNAEQAVIEGEGERRITVRSRREGERLVVAIGDSGRGIAPEHLPHIFNPFYTTKPRGIGTGLGLSISDGIIRGHDGILRVRSEPGQGALFEVILPLLSPPATDPV